MQNGKPVSDIFDEQMERIKLITGKKTQLELAYLLGVKQSAVSDAKRRGKIPVSWLAILMRYKLANPEWILTGIGPMFVSCPPKEPGYEKGEGMVEDKAAEEALRRLPARKLANELVRRIAVSREKSRCSRMDD